MTSPTASIRELSSKWTFFQKFVLPAVWFPLIAIAAALTAAQPELPLSMVALLLLAGLGGGLLIWHTCIGLKKVSLAGQELIISNYSIEVRARLDQLEKITEHRWDKARSITLTFRTDPGLGQSVRFIPGQRFLFPWQSHPTAVELRRLTGLS